MHRTLLVVLCMAPLVLATSLALMTPARAAELPSAAQVFKETGVSAGLAVHIGNIKIVSLLLLVITFETIVIKYWGGGEKIVSPTRLLRGRPPTRPHPPIPTHMQ